MQAVGYNPQADPIGNQDPGVPEAMVKMSIGLMLIGAVIMFVSFMLIYNLGKKEVADMQAKLNKTDEDEKLISMPQGDD